MASLRRRNIEDSSVDVRRDEPTGLSESIIPLAASQVKKLHKGKRHQGLLLGIGALIGFVAAALLAKQQNVIDLDFINLEGLIDVIPAGIIKDAKEITVSPLLVGHNPDWLAEADAAAIRSNLSVIRSITIRFLSVYTCSPRASRLYIRSL